MRERELFHDLRKEWVQRQKMFMLNVEGCRARGQSSREEDQRCYREQFYA